jgi:hypothetical protein
MPVLYIGRTVLKIKDGVNNMPYIVYFVGMYDRTWKVVTVIYF